VEELSTLLTNVSGFVWVVLYCYPWIVIAGRARGCVWWWLLVLLMLPIALVRLRKLVPILDWARPAWVECHQLGKYHDSDQWKSWVGIGLALYTALSGEATISRISVSLTCTLLGALGLGTWWLVVGPRHYAGRQVGR
jgi:hypothetical protein